MRKKACSDILPRFRATSCLREFATPCFFGRNILPLSGRDTLPSRVGDILPRINDFLSKAEFRVRERFGGKISYASIPFEGVDWTRFDFISVDAYRSIAVTDRYRDAITVLATPTPI